jgi:hypothetical protein
MSVETKQIIIGDHMDNLLREGREHQLEHELRDARRAGEARAHASGSRSAPDHPPARVRLGHWLIGLGSAVAGTSPDAPGGSTERAA